MVAVLLPAFGLRTAVVRSSAVASAVASAQEAMAHDMQSLLSSDSASLVDVAECVPSHATLEAVLDSIDVVERLVEANAHSVTQSEVDELERELGELGLDGEHKPDDL